MNFISRFIVRRSRKAIPTYSDKKLSEQFRLTQDLMRDTMHDKDAILVSELFVDLKNEILRRRGTCDASPLTGSS